MELLIPLLITAVVILLVAVGALGYACFNLIKKIETYEEWVELFRSESEQIYSRLKEVDDKNLFEKDDDVGFVFSEIVRVVNEFNEKVK